MMGKNVSIPRRIHFCWYGGAPLSELNQRCLKTWKDTMPGYSIVRWDESNLIDSSPYVKLSLARKRYAFAADYMRLHALYEEGGIYLDTDIEVVKPFDELLEHQFFMGYQAPGSVAVGVIGAVKGHPFLKLIMDTLDADARVNKAKLEPLPDRVTELIKHHPDDSLTLLPEEYFYPYNPYSSVVIRQKPLLSNMSANTFCVHHWEGTWLGHVSLRALLGMRLNEILRRGKSFFNVPNAFHGTMISGKFPWSS
jgi:hypothetical protein